MDMVSRGMFVGTSNPDANGVATFSPQNTMTRGQFITVIVRYLYGNELKAMPAQQGAKWWENAYMVALDHALLAENELDSGNLDKAMTRQEMAMVLVRAMNQSGEASGTTISNSRIPDYNNIGTHYRDYVKVAYTKGLIVGTDAKGTFNPQGTLNRAQAATVIYRLIAPETRKPVDANGGSINVDDSGIDINNPVSSVQTIYEGQDSERLPAKEGDIFIKADGTKIVLKNDANGILGGGQGVAPDIGMICGGLPVMAGSSWHYYGNIKLTDSLGNSIQNENYYINRSTGQKYSFTTKTQH